ncbi:MAG: AAA-like domain-containing protein, partial [Cyanobacteria bacterium P01_A01_bin.40]
ETLLANASKESGIYSHHLRRHLETLQQKPSLAASLKEVVNANQPVELNPRETYQLYSMGLVQLKDNQVIPRCNLYREYFNRVLV